MNLDQRIAAYRKQNGTTEGRGPTRPIDLLDQRWRRLAKAVGITDRQRRRATKKFLRRELEGLLASS